MWVVPLGCLLPILLCAGVISTFVVLGLQAVKQLDVYQEAVTLATLNPAAIESLGGPIQAGNPSNFQYRINGASGSAEFAIPLTGATSSGTLFVEADRVNETWNFKVLELAVQGKSLRIDLRPQEKGTAPTQPLAPTEQPLPTPTPIEPAPGP
jgi:hypothetical protein